MPESAKDNAGVGRVGRLFVDGDLASEELEELCAALDEHTRFAPELTASEIRIDLMRYHD